MVNWEIEKFVNRIIYNKENKENQRKELVHWVEMIGTHKYEKYYKIIENEAKAVSFDDIKSCAIYDFDLSELMFSLLKHFENYLRATIMNECEDVELNPKTFSIEISKAIGRTSKDIMKLNYYDWNKRTMKKRCSLSKFIDLSSLGITVKCYLILPEKYILFEKEYFQDNIKSIKNLRNYIYHHNILINDEFNNKCYIYHKATEDLKSNVINLFRYIPSRKTRQKYLDKVMDIQKKVTKDYKYVIKFSEVEKEYIMEPKGCNNDY